MTEFSCADALLILNMQDGLGIRRKHKLIRIAAPDELLNGYDAYRADIVRIIGRELSDKIEATISGNALDTEKDKLYKEGIEVITYLDTSYPDGLKNIFEFPLLLYVKGNKNLLKTKSIAVVGTRNPSRYGANVTRDFVTEFARAGLTVVSGFARGIDSISHKATLEVEGNTIAVVASGLDVCYPAENRSLMEKILSSNGLFVSEYRVGTFPATYNFPERNRIISGLADGVFVPEMRLKSGTMITVNHALEQGKTVYVVPSNINSPTGEGSNSLLKSMQGSIVLSPEDVLTDMNVKVDKQVKEPLQMSLAEQQILTVLETAEAHFEELMEATGLSVNELQGVLFNMEMNDLVDKTSGNYYTLK